MSIIAAPAAVFSTSGNKTLSQIITDLGLTTNLKLCLDAGDANSYNPAVQTEKWLDTSGNGYDFYRGTSTGGDAAEPTFNGSAGGASSNEYFSFDGGDYFLYDSANETWMNALHKNSAVFSIFIVFYPNSTAAQRYFATKGSGVGTGLMFYIQATSLLPEVFVSNGSGTVCTLNTPSAANNAAWNVYGASLDEAIGTANSLVKINSSSTQINDESYTSPSSSDVSGTTAIGSLSSGVSPLPSGSRIACLAMWEGTALTTTNLSDIYDAIKGRFGL